MKRLVCFLLFSFCLFLCFQIRDNVPDDNFNCFTIIVGKNATVDGSVLLAHNEDDPGDLLVDWHKVPRTNRKTDYPNIDGKQTKDSFSYLWIEILGLETADSFSNEWGVTICSNSCKPKFETIGSVGYELRQLIAQSTTSAREAVLLAGNLIEKGGYKNSGRTYCIADPNEAWVLAVAGKEWVAERVPDNGVAIIPNSYNIQQVDLSNSNDFLGSGDLFDYALKNGLVSDSGIQKFNFSTVYGEQFRQSHIGNKARVWYTMNQFSSRSYTLNEQFPFSFKPRKKLSVSDLTQVLQSHYEDTQYGITPEDSVGSPHKNKIRTICCDVTQYSFVAQLRNWLPVDVGTVIWTTQSRPCSQPFIPWYFGINKIPNGYERMNYDSALEAHFDSANLKLVYPDHKFWLFSDFSSSLDKNYYQKINEVKVVKEKYQKRMINDQRGFEENVMKIYKNDPQKAKNLLTQYLDKLTKEDWEQTKAQFEPEK